MLAAASLAVGACSDKTAKAYAEGETARSLMEAGDLPGASAAIGRALALRGDQVELLLLDGRIRYRMGDYGGSFDSYNMALSIDPNNPEALQAVSQIGAQTGHERESVAATDKILTLDPKNVSALLVTGVRQLNRRDFDGALATGERMLEADPQREPGLVLKARALSQSGKKAEALEMLRDGQKRLGSTQMIVTALLENAREQGDGDLMIQQFSALSGLAPKNADLTIDEANVQYKRGLTDEARKRGWALLIENGANAEAVDRLIDLWVEYDKTPLTPDRIATLASDGAPPARLAVARYYLDNGDHKAAGDLAGPLPGGEAAGLRSRIAYVSGNDTEGVTADFVLKQDETNCDALEVRAANAMRRGRPGDAVIAGQVVAAECPDRDGNDLVAKAYAAKGEMTGVRRAYMAGILAQPLETGPVLHYATWLMANGQAAEAIAVARRLTQRAPAKISAWRLLKTVCSRAAQAGCVAEATVGEAAARTSFVIDLPPGERRPNPLLGNSWR